MRAYKYTQQNQLQPLRTEPCNTYNEASVWFFM